MNDHADESSHDYPRINVDEDALALALADILAQQSIDALHELLPEHLGQFVLFQRGMQQQPVKLPIAIVFIERVEGKPLKHGAIVFLLNGVRNYLQRIELVMHTRFVIEDRAVELFLGGKVPKHHGLRDAGRLGDLLRRGATETALREQAHRFTQDLQTPIFTRHAAGIGAIHIDSFLRLQTNPAPEVSAYLPSLAD